MPSFSITPVLRQFYENLGAERYLGPAISADFEHNGATCQYTANALMCMNPQVTDQTQRFYLEPLGNSLNVSEAPNSNIEASSPFTLHNYNIYPAFMVAYNEMNGQVYLGKPISNLKYNEDKNRMEQYFENVGFYILNTPDAHVELLPYGYYSCPNCQGPKQLRPTLALPQTELNQAVVFSNTINRLGGTAIFGNPISDTITLPDGTIEQVYETVALYATADQPKVIHFRPLPIILNMPTNEPALPSMEQKLNMNFYPLEGRMEGYYVPVVFNAFIQLHGGRQVSGDPISNTFKVQGQEDTIFGRQCFVNFCLDYLRNVPEDQAIRITPLGSLYLNQNHASGQPASQAPTQPPEQPMAQAAAPAAVPANPPALQLLVSEMLPKPASNEYQTLSIAVFQSNSSQPVAGVQVIATISGPTGNQQTYTSAPTNTSGNTIVSFPPPPGAKHGDMITYQVCIAESAIQPICQFESYLIWDLN